MSINCKSNKGMNQAAGITPEKKVKWDSEARAEIRQRVQMREAFLRQLTPGIDPKQAQLELTYSKFTQELSELVTLNPSKSYGIEAFLASKLGLHKRMLGLSDAKTVAGSVREALIDAKISARNIVSGYARFYAHAQVVDAVKTIKATLKEFNFDKRQLAEITRKSIEIGELPRKRSIYNSPAANAVLDADYNDYRAYLKGLGIRDDQASTLMDSVFRVSSAFDEVQIKAKAFGVDTGIVENIGYFSRQMDEEVSRYLKTVDSAATFGDDAASVGAATGERNTWRYAIAESEFLGKLLDIDPKQVDELAEDTQLLMKTLHDKLTKEQLDTLVDAGVLAKLPQFTEDVSRYIIDNYKLPFKSAEDLYEHDLALSLNKYAERLGIEASNNSYYLRILDEGAKKGWLVTNNTGEFAGFVEVSKLSALSGTDTKYYVHPMVANQIKAIERMSGSPESLGVLANTFAYANRILNKQALTASGVAYITSNVLGSAIFGAAQGLNLQRIIPAAADFKLLFSKGFDAFDNTKKIFNDNGILKTKREALEAFMSRHGTQYVPQGVGDRVAAWQPTVEAVKNAGVHIGIYSRLFGDPVTGSKEMVGLLGRKLEKLHDVVFAPLGYVAMITDLWFKWALFQSVIRIDDVSDIYRKGWSLVDDDLTKNSFEEAFQHVDNTYLNYAKMGETQTFWARYVLPFGSFAMSNPPMVLRWAMRNPTSYINFIRLQQFANEMNDNPDVTEAGFSRFELTGLPISLSRSTRDGKVTMLYPSRYDNITEAFSFFGGSIDNFRRLTGGTSAGAANRRSDLVDKYTIKDWLGDTLGRTNAVWGTAVVALTGVDPQTKLPLKEYDTEFAGIPIDPFVGWALKRIPFLREYDKWMAPQGTEIDVRGNVVFQGQGNLPASTSQKQWRAQVKALGFYGAAVNDLLGLNIKVIDLEYNNQRTLTEIKQTAKKLEGQVIRPLELKMREKPTPEGLQQLEQARSQYIQLVVDAARVDEWKKQHGVPDGEDLNKLREQGILIRSLPIQSPAIKRFIQEEILKQENINSEARKRL